jgi:hypothetical protein
MGKIKRTYKNRRELRRIFIIRYYNSYLILSLFIHYIVGSAKLVQNQRTQLVAFSEILLVIFSEI